MALFYTSSESSEKVTGMWVLNGGGSGKDELTGSVASASRLLCDWCC